MATDWAADVKKYAEKADDAVIAGIVRYCGIALRNRDSSLVAFSDSKELDLVRNNFLKKKLARTESDDVLNAAIAKVGEAMKADRTKNRVTVYYLLADHFKSLGLFTPAAKAAKAPAKAKTPAATGAKPAKADGKVAALVGAAGLAAAASAKKPAAKKAATAKPAAVAAPAAKAPAKKVAAPAKVTTTKKAAPAGKTINPGSAAAATAVAAGGALGLASAAPAAAKTAAVKAADTVAETAKAAAEGTADVAKTVASATVDTAKAAVDLTADAAKSAAGAVEDAAKATVGAASDAGAVVAGAAGAALAGAAALASGAAGKASSAVSGGASALTGSSGNDEDSGLGWLWWLLGLALLLFLVWWLFLRGPVESTDAAVATPTEAVAPAADASAAGGVDLTAAPAEGSVAIPTGAGVTSETRNGKPVVKVYFDTAKIDLAQAFGPAAGGLKAWLAANPGSTLAISGYADPSGNAAQNEDLAKRRAEAVKAALVTQGVPEASAQLVKPDSATDASVVKEAARRVEIVVQ